MPVAGNHHLCIRCLWVSGKCKGTDHDRHLMAHCLVHAKPRGGRMGLKWWIQLRMGIGCCPTPLMKSNLDLLKMPRGRRSKAGSPSVYTSLSILASARGVALAQKNFQGMDSHTHSSLLMPWKRPKSSPVCPIIGPYFIVGRKTNIILRCAWFPSALS